MRLAVYRRPAALFPDAGIQMVGEAPPVCRESWSRDTSSVPGARVRKVPPAQAKWGFGSFKHPPPPLSSGQALWREELSEY